MKQALSILFVSLFFQVCFSQVVNIPDPNFKHALINANVDLNGDREIQLSEAELVTELDVSERLIFDITGIEEFSNLTRFACNGNEISSISLNDHPDLTFMNVGDNPLTRFSHNELPALDSLVMNSVDLDTLILDGLPHLTHLEFDNGFTFRRSVVILSRLSEFKNFRHIEAYELFVEDLASLDSINYGDYHISVKNCSALKYAFFSDEVKVNLENLPNLENLSCSFCTFENVDFNEFTNLVELIILTGNFASNHENLIIKDLKHLEVILLDIYDIVFQRVELSNLSSLNIIIPGALFCEELKLENLPRLKDLEHNFYSSSELEVITITGLDSLYELDVESPELEHFMIQGAPSLVEFSYENGRLANLDLRGLPSLKKINIEDSEGYLQELYFKDGQTSQLRMNFELPNSLYICADEEEINTITQEIMDLDPSGTLLNNYDLSSDCSYLPGAGISLVKGVARVDVEGDGCTESDPVMEGVRLIRKDMSRNIIRYTNKSGEYRYYLHEGLHQFEVEAKNPLYYSLDIEEFEVEFPFDTNIIDQDICLSPIGSFNDLRINITPIGVLRPGFETDFIISYKNEGTTTLSGKVELRYMDSYTDYIFSSPGGIDQGGIIVWEFEDLQVQEERKIRVTLRFNSPMDSPPLNGGDVVDLSAIIFPIEEDEQADNNSHHISLVLVNAYDPNDKTCLQGKSITPEMIGKEVDYVIRFENSGNAEAVNIVVRDRIDTSVFEISTLRINDASHKMETRVVEGNLVEFIFEEIYLPFDDANNDGYVSFSIKMKDDLTLGDQLENTAEIYFDFNWPIITNTAVTQIGEPVFVRDFNNEIDMVLAPNPTQGSFTIQSDESFYNVSVIDFAGRLVKKIEYLRNLHSTSLDISNLNTGTYTILVETSKGFYAKKMLLID